MSGTTDNKMYYQICNESQIGQDDTPRSGLK